MSNLSEVRERLEKKYYYYDEELFSLLEEYEKLKRENERMRERLEWIANPLQGPVHSLEDAINIAKSALTEER